MGSPQSILGLVMSRKGESSEVQWTELCPSNSPMEDLMPNLQM